MANKTICALTYGDTHVFTLPYGTCSSNAASVAKTVAVQDGKFSLETGARVLVKFTVTNTALNPTLNVSSTGAKAIYCKGSAIKPDQLAAKGIYEFVYDGTYWEMVGNADAMPRAQVEDMIRDVSNYNFIKNWNMENPINTKGQDSYTGGQYTIDGWYATNNVNSVVINKDNYITITNTQPSTYMWFRQYLDCGYLPYGTYTLSVLVESCGDCSVYFCNDEGNAVGGNVYALDPGLNTFTQTIDTSTCSRIQFVVGYNTSLSLRGVKIERGSLQTLAVQRPDGTWELKTDGWDPGVEEAKNTSINNFKMLKDLSSTEDVNIVISKTDYLGGKFGGVDTPTMPTSGTKYLSNIGDYLELKIYYSNLIPGQITQTVGAYSIKDNTQFLALFHLTSGGGGSASKNVTLRHSFIIDGILAGSYDDAMDFYTRPKICIGVPGVKEGSSCVYRVELIDLTGSTSMTSSNKASVNFDHLQPASYTYTNSITWEKLMNLIFE